MSIMPTRMPPRPQKHPTNCRNCGAPLHGSVCEYCGTEYGEQDKEFEEVGFYANNVLVDVIRRPIGSVMLLDSGIEVAHMPTITRR